MYFSTTREFVYFGDDSYSSGLFPICGKSSQLESIPSSSKKRKMQPYFLPQKRFPVEKDITRGLPMFMKRSSRPSPEIKN